MRFVLTQKLEDHRGKILLNFLTVDVELMRHASIPNFFSYWNSETIEILEPLELGESTEIQPRF